MADLGNWLPFFLPAVAGTGRDLCAQAEPLGQQVPACPATDPGVGPREDRELATWQGAPVPADGRAQRPDPPNRQPGLHCASQAALPGSPPRAPAPTQTWGLAGWRQWGLEPKESEEERGQGSCLALLFPWKPPALSSAVWESGQLGALSPPHSEPPTTPLLTASLASRWGSALLGPGSPSSFCSLQWKGWGFST